MNGASLVAVIFGLTAVFLLCCSSFEWMWLWRVTDKQWIVDFLGIRNMRLLCLAYAWVALIYLFSRISVEWLQISIFVGILIGISLSTILAILIFRQRKGQTLVSFLMNKPSTRTS